MPRRKLPPRTNRAPRYFPGQKERLALKGLKIVNHKFVKLSLSSSSSSASSESESESEPDYLSEDELKFRQYERESRKWIKKNGLEAWKARRAKEILVAVLRSSLTRVVEIMNHPDYSTRSDEMESDVVIAECCMIRTCKEKRSHLPAGWKYDRKNASSLLAGLDGLFKEDTQSQT